MYRISVCVIRKIQDTVIHLLVIRIKQQQQCFFFYSNTRTVRVDRGSIQRSAKHLSLKKM